VTRGAALAAALAAALPATTAFAHDPRGTYLDYARLPPFAAGASITLDRRGLPRVWYSARLRAAYNPTTMAQFGLQQLSYFLAGRGARHLRAAERAAAWLVRTQSESGAWLYGFRWRVIGARLSVVPPWPSAIAQGQAMSLLARMYGRTGRGSYLQAARAARRPLTTPVARGGLLARLRGRPWYEEYPTHPSSFVLNGFMFALLGLRDLHAVDPAPATRQLYERGIESLAASLPLFDAGGASLYHLARTRAGRAFVAPLRYQRLHVKLLAALATASRDPALARYRDRWRRHLAAG
jgi:heparosan-N-sulfate-glucuronate 5-epimerase